MGHDILRMGEIIAERFHLLADGARGFLGREAEQVKNLFVFNQHLHFIGELKAGEQR